MTPRQCRAARAFKNWTQAQLAEKSETSMESISRFEAGSNIRVRAIVKVMRQTFEREGIVFLGDHGIDSVDNML